ncbi:hypothetical protein B0H11DRAFT_802923 [Mycena galericulata]|nr:hypothetical protein B0H11DRAFT_802923 [Mycena galericulata]
MSSPNKSFRSRMGGVMRRTSSVLAISRPGTPTPSGSPAPPSDEGRRSSISKSVEGRKSTASLTPSGATPPAPVAPPEPQPQPQLPTIAVDPTLEVAPAPPPESVPEPASAPAPAPAPEPEPSPEPERAAPPSSEEVPTPTPPPAAQANGTHKAVKRLLPIAAQYQMYPSPIAESPAREAAASEEELAATRAAAAEVAAQRLLEGDSVPAADAPVPEPAPQAIEPEPVAIPEPQVKEEQAYVPPPLIGDSSNPGAFTDEPEEMSMPRPEPAPAPAAAVPAPAEVATAEPAIPDPAPAPAPVAVLVVEQPIPVSEPPAPIPVIAPIAPAVEPSPALDDYAYFDLVPRASVHSIAVPAAAAGVSPASDSDTIVGVDPAARQRQPDVGVSPYPYDIRPAQADDAQVEVQGEPQLSAAVEPVREIPDLEAQVRREWAGADEGGWESNAVFMPVTAATTTTQVVNEDPFADPPAPQRSQEGNLNAETEIDVPRREREADDSVFLIPIAVVDHDGDREQEGGISSIPMPVPATEFGVGAPLGFEYVHIFPER